MSPFDAAVAWLLDSEGDAYTDAPNDRGGPTRYGITQQALAGWLNRPVAAAEVARLSRADAVAFYAQTYWTPLCGDALAAARPGLATALLDQAVLMGPGPAVRALQAAVGAPADGRLGPTTFRAVVAAPAAPALVAFVRQCAPHYIGLAVAHPPQAMWLNGWLRRLLRLLDLLPRAA